MKNLITILIDISDPGAECAPRLGNCIFFTIDSACFTVPGTTKTKNKWPWKVDSFVFWCGAEGTRLRGSCFCCSCVSPSGGKNPRNLQMRIHECHFLKSVLNLDLTLPDDGESHALLISSRIIDLGAFCVELWSVFVSKRISVPMSYISFWKQISYDRSGLRSEGYPCGPPTLKNKVGRVPLPKLGMTLIRVPTVLRTSEYCYVAFVNLTILPMRG